MSFIRGMKLKRRAWVYIVLALACILYGVWVGTKGYGTVFFMIWIFIAAVFAFMALAAQKSIWKKLPRLIRRCILGLVGIGLVFFVWVEGLILSQVNAKGADNLDYVIVLGAMVHEDGPSSILAARLNAAIEYLEENPDTKVIVSGGQGSNEPFSEAEGMRRYLVEKGISEDRIILEPNSFNTKENIQNSMELIDDSNARVGIATSNFHVYRACKIAKKNGLKNVSGISGNVILFYMPQNLFREFFGVVKDYMVGNM